MKNKTTNLRRKKLKQRKGHSRCTSQLYFGKYCFFSLQKPVMEIQLTVCQCLHTLLFLTSCVINAVIPLRDVGIDPSWRAKITTPFSLPPGAGASADPPHSRSLTGSLLRLVIPSSRHLTVGGGNTRLYLDGGDASDGFITFPFLPFLPTSFSLRLAVVKPPGSSHRMISAPRQVQLYSVLSRFVPFLLA